MTGVTVCWMADRPAITAAAERGHNLIICHEAVTFPHPGFSGGADQQQPELDWRSNAQRLGLLKQHNISVCRLHSLLDELYIYDAFCKQLGLTEVHAAGPYYCDRLYTIEPVSYAELIEEIKTTMDMTALRASRGPAERIIRTVGVPWGGMALFVNIPFMQNLMELGAVDVMIAGETDNYGFRFCAEQGVDLIETSHEISEQRGLQIFTDELARAEPEIDVICFENQRVWHTK